jgi:L-alanine-DL-glutamate epimerase-like enolase superfamily enzyme
VKITGIETVLFEPTWDDPLAYKHRRTFGALTIHTDEGLCGISRTWADGARHIHDLFKPALLGEDPRNVEHIWAKLYGLTVPYLGQERALVAAIGALDIALWDLFGRSVGLPCWQLLGGYRDWVPAYADVPIRNETLDELGAQLAASVAAGYDAVKFHIINRDPDHIVEQARVARAMIGSETKLMVDIFRALDPPTAIAVARQLEAYDITWLEERCAGTTSHWASPWSRTKPAFRSPAAKAKARYSAAGTSWSEAASRTCRPIFSAAVAIPISVRSRGWRKPIM